MKHGETIAPVAAAAGAAATLVCCLPIAFTAGTALAAFAVVAGTYYWWFMAASVLLLAVGAAQLARAKRACRVRGSASTVILAVSAAVVFLVLFFPQLVASLIADLVP